MPVVIGANSQHWQDIHADVAGLTVYLTYHDGQAGPDGVPAAWPSAPPGAVQMACIKPDPALFLAGKLNGPVKRFLAGAPDYAMACCWQEGNDPAPQKAGGYTPAQWAAMSRLLRELAGEVNPTLQAGQKFATYPVWAQGQRLAEWVDQDCHWAGFDGYQYEASHDPHTVFGRVVAEVRDAAPNARLAITETGSRVDQARWLPAVFRFARDHRMFAFMPYFGVGGASDPAPYEYSADLAPVLQRITAHATAC